jgi:hypothetical protein
MGILESPTNNPVEDVALIDEENSATRYNLLVIKVLRDGAQMFLYRFYLILF